MIRHGRAIGWWPWWHMSPRPGRPAAAWG